MLLIDISYRLSAEFHRGVEGTMLPVFLETTGVLGGSPETAAIALVVVWFRR